MINYIDVPYYSQFQDIPAVEWQKKGCGIASLAMAIGFYKPDEISVSALLKEGIVSGAYVKNVGWSHQGLTDLVTKYGLVGEIHDLTKLKSQKALIELKEILNDGPVIASIHNKFDPKAILGHLVVVTGYDDQFIFYHDPASTKTEKKISNAGFLAGWKKKIISVRQPTLNLPQISGASISDLGAL